ncbi:MAG: OmpA/MotB family protein [Solidesulfovibrio sp. DCME]|uniref:OmpA/MotB family protein n=1 Tax=Solidesulfovibrio sp. DCME TaxID=3447380 RepID=UPI003D0C8E42
MLTAKKRPAPTRPQKLPGFPKSHGSSWKVAYADFVTAMMAFFLLMWILAMVPPSVQRQLEDYFKATPAALQAGLSPEKNDKQAVAPRSRDEAMRYAIALRFKKIITEDPFLKAASGISADDVGVLLRIQNGVLFTPGSASLTAEAKRILADAVDILKTYNVSLIIRGHADAEEAAKGNFASNWELSGARAAAAARYLIAAGDIEPTRIRAVAYGDSRPLVPNLSADAAARNRRVEFYFHRPDAVGSQVLY